MERSYLITAELKGVDLPGDQPQQLRDVTPSAVTLDGVTTYRWRFDEANFAAIPIARSWLQSVPDVHLFESGERHHNKADVRQAPLVWLADGTLQDGEVLEEAVFERDTCAVCGLESSVVKDDPKLRLTAPALGGVGLFGVPGTGLKIASESFLDRLREAQFATGLRTFEIDAGGAADPPLYGLISDISLGSPAAPYGWMGEPCPGCGRHIVRSARPEDRRAYRAMPRYSFYQLYERPGEEADWMWAEDSPREALLITARTRDWLFGEGAAAVGSGGRLRTAFNLQARGWYPDERELAFLPEEFHA